MIAFSALGRAKRANDKALRLFAAGDYHRAGVKFTKVLARVAPRLTGRPDFPVIALAASAHVGLGRVRLRSGAFKEAIPEFRAAQGLQPHWWDAFYWEGCARAHTGDDAGAERSFTAALRCKPASVRTHLQRAYVRIRSGDDQGALADLSWADRHGALDERARLVVAYVLLRRRDAAGAIRQASLIGHDRVAWAGYALLGLARAWEGRYREAEDLLGHTLTAGLDDGATLFWHGLAAYQLGHFEGSTSSWTRLRDRHPHRTRLALLVARSAYGQAVEYARADRLEEAMTQLAAVSDHGTSDAHDRAIADLSLHAAARTIRMHGVSGSDHAARLLAEGATRAPDDPRFDQYLAVIAALQGDPAATAASRRALAAGSLDASDRLVLTLCMLSAGDGANGIEDLAALASTGPAEVAARARSALAILLMRESRWREAAQMLETLSAEDPLRNLLPECLYRAGDHEALRRLWSANAFGWRALAAGDLEGAVLIAQGLPDSPSVDRMRRELGRLLSQEALAEAARQQWDRSATLVARRREIGFVPSPDPHIDALALLLGGQRPVALAAMRSASDGNPARHRLTHSLAVMLLHTLGADATQNGAATWHECIASWTVLLHNDAFWAEWTANAHQRYGTAISAAQLDATKTRLRELLQDRARAYDRQGEALVLLERELAAAKALAEAGGLALPGSDAALACGPLRIAELGMERSLAAHAGVLDLVLRRKSGPIRILFSQLGIAQVHLLADRPEEALKTLRDLRCEQCRLVKVRRTSGPATASITCRQGCAGFDAANPGYAGLASGNQQLIMDATDLAVQAHLRCAERAATATPLDAQGAQANWRQALQLSEDAGRRGRTVEQMVKTALGRAKAFERDDDFDEAIAVVEAAHAVTRQSDGKILAGRLAELLTYRAVVTAQDAPELMENSLSDLRRAHTLNPHSIGATVNFSRVAQEVAERRLTTGDLARATELLTEAAAKVKRLLDRNPQHTELIEEQRQIEVYLGMAALFAGLMRRQ